MKAVYIHRFFFFLLLFFLPSQLNYHFWPDWSFVLGRKIDLLSPVIYATDFFILGTLLFWVTSCFKEIAQKKTVFLLLLCISFAGVNSIFSIHPLASLLSWLRAASYLLLAFYVSNTRPPLRFLTVGLFLGSFIPAVVGVGQIIQQQSLGGIWYFFGERTFLSETPGIANTVLCINHFLKHQCFSALRPYATFPHPNVFAGYLVFLFFILLSAARQKQQSATSYPGLFMVHTLSTRLAQILYYRLFQPGVVFSVCTLLFVGVVLSASRSALLGLTIGILWYRVITTRHRLYIGSSALFLFIILVHVIVSLTNETALYALEIRKELLDSAKQIIQQYWLFGVGLDQFIRVLPEFITSRNLYFLQPVHNIYVLFLAETGVVGVLFCGVVGFFLYRLNWFKLNIHSLPILMPLLLIGLLDHYPLTLHQGLIISAVAIGLVFQKNAILK